VPQLNNLLAFQRERTRDLFVLTATTNSEPDLETLLAALGTDGAGRPA
jgi:hypothetical protein